MRLAGLFFVVALTACAPNMNDTEKAHVSIEPVFYEEIVPYIAPITYRQLIVDQCGIVGPNVKTTFLRELERLRVSTEDIARVEMEMQRIARETGNNEDEYVCTPEMFEQSQLSADEAMQALSDLRG